MMLLTQTTPLSGTSEQTERDYRPRIQAYELQYGMLGRNHLRRRAVFSAQEL